VLEDPAWKAALYQTAGQTDFCPLDALDMGAHDVDSIALHLVALDDSAQAEAVVQKLTIAAQQIGGPR